MVSSHLGVDALHQLSYGQFHQLRHQQLLLRDALQQPLLLFLFLYLGLCHLYSK